MSVQVLAQVDPTQFINLFSAGTGGSGAGATRLDMRISEVDVSTDFSGRLSVMTAEGDKITIPADE